MGFLKNIFYGKKHVPKIRQHYSSAESAIKSHYMNTGVLPKRVRDSIKHNVNGSTVLVKNVSNGDLVKFSNAEPVKAQTLENTPFVKPQILTRS